jgi:hypothetical protein
MHTYMYRGREGEFRTMFGTTLRGGISYFGQYPYILGLFCLYTSSLTEVEKGSFE